MQKWPLLVAPLFVYLFLKQHTKTGVKGEASNLMQKWLLLVAPLFVYLFLKQHAKTGAKGEASNSIVAPLFVYTHGCRGY